MSKPFMNFSWNGKWKTVSNHLKYSLNKFPETDEFGASGMYTLPATTNQ